MKLSIIVAMTKGRVIGLGNNLPWHLPEELKLFSRLTIGHPVIMGRKTQNSIGFPLKGRTNIVISSNINKIQGYVVVRSFDQALRVTQKIDTDECFVIGGAQIYTLAFPFITKMYISQVHGNYEGDIYFPECHSKKQWPITSIQREKTFDLIIREKLT